MRRSLLVRLTVAALAFVACCGSYADAHPLGNFTINHLTVLRVSRGTLDVRYVLDVAEIPSVALDRAISANGSPSAREYAAWARRHAAEIVPQLEVRADGVQLPLQVRTAAAAPRPGAAGLHTIRMTAAYSAHLPARGRSVTYADATERGRLGWRDVVLAPAAEPTHELQQYPSALIGSPRARTTLALQIDGAGVAHVAADAGAVAARAPSAARSNALSELLSRQNGGPLVLIGALVIAVALGALHALEPGHGKTLLAVSLVGARATPSQAVILASSLTIAHTLGVLVLGGIVLYATRWIVPEAIYPWLTLLSGVLVAVVAARALNAAVRARRPRAHQHVHAHDHAHPHEHEHAHGFGFEELHHHGRADVDSDDDEAHARAHAVPGTAPLTFRSAVLAAASGNIAPCPAALVVLLAAIALHQIAFGLGLIVAFSFGLAGTLTVLGVAVVRGAAWLAGRPQFERVARFAPLLSATVIAVIAAVMIGEGMVQQGVAAPALLVAALALTAIAGYAFMLPHEPARGRAAHA